MTLLSHFRVWNFVSRREAPSECERNVTVNKLSHSAFGPSPTPCFKPNRRFPHPPRPETLTPVFPLALDTPILPRVSALPRRCFASSQTKLAPPSPAPAPETTPKLPPRPCLPVADSQKRHRPPPIGSFQSASLPLLWVARSLLHQAPALPRPSAPALPCPRALWPRAQALAPWFGVPLAFWVPAAALLSPGSLPLASVSRCPGASASAVGPHPRAVVGVRVSR